MSEVCLVRRSVAERGVRATTVVILAYGFARARCDECDHDFLVAFSCKSRGVCPACNTRRMAETAAHLADHVLPQGNRAMCFS